MSVLLDVRPHAAALKAAMDAALTPWSAYDFDEVPGTDGNPGKVPAIQAQFSVERRPNSLTRTPGRAGSAGWRVAVRSVGTTVNEARWCQNRVALALNESRLLVGDKHTSRLQYESGQAAEKDDDGTYSALDIYTYRH